MSQTLRLTNFNSLNILEQTQLSAIVNAAATTLVVLNNRDFASGNYILLGVPSSKTSEIVSASGVSGATSITLSAGTTLIHNAYEPVIKLFGDKIRIYRAPNVDGSAPADAAFSLLTTISIDPNDTTTSYTDASGGGDYWYKYTYYNSTSTQETDRTLAAAARGTFTVNYCSTDEIRQEAGFKYAAYIDDTTIDQKRTAAQDEINGTLSSFYDVPFQPPIDSSLKNICITLAAGLLLVAQYSAVSAALTANGQAKIDSARVELEKLASKQRILVDKQGKALALSGGTGGVDGWPNASTATTDGSSGGAPRIFRMSDVQGQPMSTDTNGNPAGNLYYGRRW
jgi:hypothetical protein